MVLAQLEYWQIAILFLPMLFVFWTLWHIAKHSFPTAAEKFYWIALCSLTSLLGCFIYLIWGMRRTIKEKNNH